MRCVRLYPDQILCFLLGFLPTGIWVALLAATAELFFDALSRTAPSSANSLFLQTFLIYGVPASFFGQLLGYWLRNYKPDSPDRWLWLSFLVPCFTFPLAGLQVEITELIESGLVTLKYSADEVVSALAFVRERSLAIWIALCCHHRSLKIHRPTRAPAHNVAAASSLRSTMSP